MADKFGWKRATLRPWPIPFLTDWKTNPLSDKSASVFVNPNDDMKSSVYNLGYNNTIISVSPQCHIFT